MFYDVKHLGASENEIKSGGSGQHSTKKGIKEIMNFAIFLEFSRLKMTTSDFWIFGAEYSDFW